MSWLIVAITGLVVSGSANALWLSRGRAMISVAVARELRGLIPSRTTLDAPAEADEPWSTAEGLHRYHRPDCTLMKGRRARPVRRDADSLSGLVACEVCEPA
jgi:hypothetical protein